MIRKNQEFINRVNNLLDILLVTVSYIFASWFYLEFLEGHNEQNMAAVSGHTVLLALAYSLVLFMILSLLGFYNTTRLRSLVWKTRIIFISVTIATLIGSTFLFLFRLVDFSRGVITVFYLTTLVALVAKYAFMRLVLRRIRGKGFNLKQVVVIGAGQLARQYEKDIADEPDLGFRIRGFVGTLPPEETDKEKDKYLGDFDQLDEQLASPEVSEAVIALDLEDYPRIRDVIAVCERNGVKYSVIPFYNDIIPANPVVETIGRSKLINMRSNRLENMGWSILKRGFDLVSSALGLVLLSPLLLLIALCVKCSSPGPVFFRQTRVGYQRREFRMLKFRSMRTNDEEETAWSTDVDPRRTRIGAFLRKFSLDELPQLFNVLKGDMSLVGPRPELPHFVEQFRETIPFYMVKHQVKPGMTGWAQVNGYRGDTSIEERIRLDLWYIDHWSVWLDLRILARTLFGGMINREITNGRQTESKQKAGGKQTTDK